MKTITKEITILNAVNLVAHYKKIRENEKDKLDVFSLNAKWNLKKNMDILTKAIASYEEFRIEEDKKINDKYFSDQYSDPTTIKKVIEGEEKEIPGRQVKSEYMQEYKEARLKFIEELSQLAAEQISVEIFLIDFQTEIDELNKNKHIDTSCLKMDDLDFLGFFQE